MALEKIAGGLGVLDLLETDEATLLAFAVAAAAHIEAQGRVAQLLEQRGGGQHIAGVHIAAEAVQQQEGGPALAGGQPVGNAHGAGEGEMPRFETDALFGHGSPQPDIAMSAVAASCCFSMCQMSWR